MAKPQINVFTGTVEELKVFVEYNPDNGAMCSKPPKGRIQWANMRSGHKKITLPDGKRYRVDYLAWYLMTGTWPEGRMFYANRLRSDTSIENLVYCDKDNVHWWFGPHAGSARRELIRLDKDESDEPQTFMQKLTTVLAPDDNTGADPKEFGLDWK